jgi:DNA-binding transcriptional regulator YdaS (Cro superfamily)
MIIGKYNPSPDMALRIEKATKGKVDRLELLYPNSKD